MAILTSIGGRRALTTVSAVTLGLLLSAPLYAQSSTSTVRGTVAGAAAGTVVTARSVATGFTARSPVSATGSYVLAGLAPGSYELSVPRPGGAATTRTVIVGVGENVTFDFDAPEEAGVPGADPSEPAGGEMDADIVVIGTRLIETRTSEVATNVSVEQLRTLPQTDRNFLSFAALAPGVRFNDSETDKSIASGASTSSQVNIFVDGLSLKNNVTEGGIAGQQNSRGNPFPQLGISEFRVLTQNYKAEYEQAGAAIITAITKSGTNEFHGEVFGSYTDKKLSETSVFVKRRSQPEPAFERKQYGIALGGPIVRDTLFFFGTYEGNDQDRAFNVNVGGTPEQRAAISAASGRDVNTLAGSFVSPFRQDSYFGKLTAVGGERHTFDLSYSRREETDIQGFGNQTAFEAAENKINVIDTINFQYRYRGDSFVNEFSATYLNSTFEPTALNPDLPAFVYDGIITFGGKDSTRAINQKSMTIRNDFTLTDVQFAGAHVIKMGVRYAVQDYSYDDRRNPQPRYFFRNDTANGLDLTFPGEATLGQGNPITANDNYQLGLFIQDDWEVTEKLTLNLGVRWDYETNQFNSEYITPGPAAALLRALPVTDYFNGADFITDGNDRKGYKNAFQPRLGFSYDFGADQRTVLFGGFGRYFDRNAFNNARDESYRTQYDIGRFFFSRDGLPRDGNPTVIFRPEFLTREGLLQLQATDATGLPELFAVKNKAKPPRTDQFSVGLRQKLGEVQASVTGSYIRGKNGFTNLFATRRPNNDCCDTDLARSFGFSNVLIGVDELDTRYYALYVKLEKPYTVASGWGVDVAYTLQKAEQNGNDLFSLDKPTPDDFGFRDRPGVERHQLILSGIVDLPLGLRFSTLSTFGTGQAFQVFDATRGFSVNNTEIRSAFPRKNCIGVFARCEVNLTLEKQFELFDTHRLGFAVDVFNAFNNKNFTNFEGFIPPEGQPRFGQPNDLLTLPRRIQFRAFYRF